MVSHVDIGALNKSSARVATFKVRIFAGRVTSYSYKAKSSGAAVTSYKFEAYLLGAEPSKYCVGYVKGNKQQADQAKQRFLDGSVWILRKTVLDPNAAPMYISTPIQFRVDLTKSTTVAASSVSDEDQSHLATCAVPPLTVADAIGIKTTRAIDLLAVVKSVSRERESKTKVAIVDVTLIDNSTTSDGRYATVVVSVWGADKVAQMHDSLGKPMAFLNLLANCKDGAISIDHYANDVAMEPPACEQTEALRNNQDELTGTTHTQQLTTAWAPTNTARDVSGRQPLSCAAFLDFAAEAPHADMPEVVQLNWAYLEEPEEHDNVTDSSGTRIWYHVPARDVSGSTSLGVPQKHAFALSSTSTKEEFQTKHAAGSLGMPLFCNMRISRSTRTGQTTGAAQLGAASASQESPFGQRTFVNHTIEAVDPVSWDVKAAPNASYNDVLNILNNCPPHEEGIIFAYLAEIKADRLYGFAVNHDDGPAHQAMYAAALIASEGKSQHEDCGGGYAVTTAGIKDIANPNGEDHVYTVTGFCGKEDLMNFRLGPPRGKAHRGAIALFSKVEGTKLHLHKLEYIEPSQMDGAIKCVRKLRALSKKIRPTATEKRSRAMDHLFQASPRDTKKCRSLQLQPTDDSLAET